MCDRRTQEKRKIDQHGPVAELEGGQQRGDPGHGRGREQAGIEHRARTAPLLPDKQGRRCRTANEAGGSEDQGTVAPQQRIDRQAQRNRQQGDADGIQPSLALVVRLGDQQRHRQGQRQAEGDVCKKDPAPAEPRGEEAPEGRPQCHGDAGDHPHDAERTGPLSDVRKGDCDECGPARGHEGGACSLYDAHGQEHRFAQSHPARDRSDEKHRIAGQHAAPAAEAVGKGAGRKEGAGEGKTIGVDDPGQAGDAQSNVFRDGGHGDHDRRHIEQYQESA